jgi:flagellar assembly protein FliH
MSSGGPVPKERLSAYQRWEMASFDPVPPVVPEVPDPYLGELAQRREQSHQEGYAAGFAQAQESGYAAGHEQGFKQGLIEAQAEAAILRSLSEAFSQAVRAADAEIAEHLLTLAFAIARQVIGQNIAVDPTSLITVARELIESEPALSGGQHLLVNPADLPVIETYLKDELAAGGWTVRTDPAIERGGCRANSATGEVDGTLQTRWERVAATIRRNDVW